MLNVERKKYERIVRASRKLQPRSCVCGSVGVLVTIHHAIYGTMGVRCECASCGLKGTLHSINDCVACEDGIATPITPRSLARGVKNAVKEWEYLMIEYRQMKKRKDD